MRFDMMRYASLYHETYRLGRGMPLGEDRSKTLRDMAKKVSNYLDDCGLKVPYYANPHNEKGQSV